MRWKISYFTDLMLKMHFMDKSENNIYVYVTFYYVQIF